MRSILFGVLLLLSSTKFCSPLSSSGTSDSCTECYFGRKVTIGVVANDIFGEVQRQPGSYGWLAITLVRYFHHRPQFGIRIVLVDGSKFAGDKNHVVENIHVLNALYVRKLPLYREEFKEIYQSTLSGLGVDLVLVIDFYPIYTAVMKSLPGIPFVIWLQDPVTESDRDTLGQLRIPSGRSEQQDQVLDPLFWRGVGPYNLGRFLEDRDVNVTIAISSPYMQAEIEEALGLPEHYAKQAKFLPYPINLNPKSLANLPKAKKPTCIWINQLDPLKRPWIALEFSKRLPRIEFWFLTTKGGYVFPVSTRKQYPNVHFFDFTNRTDSVRRLRQSWFLLSTSAHEGLSPVFLESLYAGTIIVSTTNPENIPGMFGFFVGEYGGNGLGSLWALERGLKFLIQGSNEAAADDYSGKGGAETRQELASRGTEWAYTTHNMEKFLERFREILGPHLQP